MSKNNPFADLDDGSFDKELGSDDYTIDRSPLEDGSPRRSVATVARYEETCRKCGGSGNFASYRGNVVGKCFSCNGVGKLLFKTSPEQREADRCARQKRKESKREAALGALDEDVRGWIIDNAASFDFARSLLDQIGKGRELSEKQVAAVRRCLDRQAAKRKEREANSTQTAGLVKLVEAFAAAKASGLKRPRLQVGELKFSAAPDSGRNAGYLYVKDDADTYLGKVDPNGAFFAGRDCTSEHKELIEAIGDDPLREAVLHGKRTGSCSCCGRELTNPESIELGIGPICREKWGWA